MAAGAGGCRPIWGCSGGDCTLAFLLGGWPCSGGGEKRKPSAPCDLSAAGTYPAAVSTGMRARVWSPANARRTASKHGTYSYPCWRPCCGTNLVDPKWALRASLTAAVIMVSGLRPETSMIYWRGSPSVSRGGGGRMPPAGGRLRPGT